MKSDFITKEIFFLIKMIVYLVIDQDWPTANSIKKDKKTSILLENGCTVSWSKTGGMGQSAVISVVILGYPVLLQEDFARKERSGRFSFFCG